MTTAQAITYFNILIDKYGSPYFTDSEVVNFLNHAQYEYLNRLFPDSQGGVVNFEFDQNTAMNLKPLMYTLTATMSGAGLVTDTTLNTALQTASGDASATVFRIGAVGFVKDGVTYPARYVKQNNLFSFERNFFKKPTSPNRIRYTLLNNSIEFFPTDTESSGLKIRVIKNPRTLDIATPVNPEFGDYTMFNIIVIAAQLAGVSVRDQELLGTLQGANVGK